LVGGLFDALIGRQHHLPAITSTNGISTFLDAWLPLVRGRRVAGMSDVGEEGEMHRLVAKLRDAGAQAWPVRLSRLLNEGKDLTDYLVQGGTRERLVALINPRASQNPEPQREVGMTQRDPLAQATTITVRRLRCTCSPRIEITGGEGFYSALVAHDAWCPLAPGRTKHRQPTAATVREPSRGGEARV
jgi:hypothetical protein